MKKISVILLCFLCYGNLFSSHFNLQLESSLKQIKKLISEDKYDSANFIIINFDLSHDDVNKNKINSNNLEIDFYKKYSFFTSEVIKIKLIPRIKLHKLLNKYLIKPKGKLKVNIDYVKIKWQQLMFLVDAGHFEEADFEYIKLNDYISTFKPSCKLVKEAKIYKNSYKSVLAVLSGDFKKVDSIYNENIIVSKQLNDTSLIIASEYYHSESYIFKRDLEGYISMQEEVIKLDNLLKEHTEFYCYNLLHLVDAYTFKKGEEKEIDSMLNIVYNTIGYKENTYSYYINFIGFLDTNSVKSKKILKKFGVDNVLAFCDTISALSKDNVVPNEYHFILDACSKTLEIQGYTSQALIYKDEVIKLIKKIYSTDLTESLVLSRTRHLEREKKKEIDYEKSKTKFYYFLLILLAIILITLLISFLSQRKINKRLRKSYKIIDFQKKEIGDALVEKQILLKEIHHRVKNNFQIITSLMDLQVEKSKDQKTKKLINEGKNRIKSMALIHQKLYIKEKFKIDFADYVKSLVSNINIAYAIYDLDYYIEIEESYTLDIDTAIPLGLIINELISNAFKYAFEEGKSNKLFVKLQIGVPFNTIEISDNGRGIEEGFNIKKTDSIGLKLVNNLAKQLHGDLSYSYNKGSKFSVTFKETKARKEVD